MVADDGYAGPGIVPQSVVPAQWSWGPQSAASARPEARLMLAVLDDALAALGRSARLDTPGARRETIELETWFTSEDCSWPFSFVNICATLSIDPEAMREAALGRNRGRRRSGRRVRQEGSRRIRPRERAERRVA